MENSKPKISLKSFLTGKFLASEKLAKNWPFILYVSLLALVMIGSSHRAERKVYTIDDLESRVKDLSSKHIELKTKLMQESLEDRVLKRAAAQGLVKGSTPPRQILVTPEEYRAAL